jgi:hypothetical protein
MYKLVISDDEGHATVVPLLRDEITICATRLRSDARRGTPSGSPSGTCRAVMRGC